MKVLRRTLLFLLLILTLNDVPAWAQFPAWLSIAPDIVQPPENPCLTVFVGDGENMTVYLRVRLPSAEEVILPEALVLDSNGQGSFCVDEYTSEGLYVFTGVQNSEYWYYPFVPTWAPFWIIHSPPPPPPPPPPSPPVLTDLGVGCEDWDCVLGAGANFDAETRVVIGRGPYEQGYYGPALETWPLVHIGPDGQSFWLQVMDPTLRWLLSWDGLDVLVMNRDATATSQWGFVRGRQPEIHFAEPTCPDLYCLSFEGVFPRDARIDFRTREGSDVLQDAYTDLVVTPSHITLRLTPSGRYAYDTEGLRAWAVNPVMFNWSTDYYLPPIDRSVIGAIHGIAQIGSEYYLHGWACAKTHAESIDIHLYAREPAGDVFLLAATANASSGPEYAAACASTGSHYAFWVHIPSEIRQQHLAQPLLVYGISPFGLSNAALVSSGAFVMPGTLAIPHRDYIYLGSRVLAVDSQ